MVLIRKFYSIESSPHQSFQHGQPLNRLDDDDIDDDDDLDEEDIDDLEEVEVVEVEPTDVDIAEVDLTDEDYLEEVNDDDEDDDDIISEDKPSKFDEALQQWSNDNARDIAEDDATPLRSNL